MLIFSRIHLCLFLLLPVGLLAQSEMPVETQQFLAQYQLEWQAPEAELRWHKRPVQQHQQTVFGLTIRKQKVNILYDFIPTAEREHFVPHIKTGALAIHLASNEEDAYLVAHEVPMEVVDSVYQADWARIFFFPPKDIFSEYDNCQMTAIYRDGVGLALVYVLFDDAPLALEEYAQLLRFQAIAPEED